MRPSYRLVIESGPEAGAVFDVPQDGCGIGRSTQNDLPLTDGQLSRMHCRLQFRGDELWVTDLASANGTLVNDAEISQSRLAAGDRIGIGETVLRLVASGSGEGDAAVAAGDGAAEDDPGVDLGFGKPVDSSATPGGSRRLINLAIAAFLALLVLAGAIRWIMERPAGTGAPAPIEALAKERLLEIRYEKTEGGPDNIFRYELKLDAERNLSVAIDDLSQSRHVRRESAQPVSEELLRELARQIEECGFFALDAVYEGIASPNKLNSYDLTVVLGTQVQRVRVRNRAEPESFEEARERVETFVRNELGLWAVEYSRERLERMARDAYLLGVKLMQEKDIQAGNLYAAGRSFLESIQFMETVEPKPDFVEGARSGLREANAEMEKRYTDCSFRADRAIKLKDWETAAEELRSVLELIPDRSDNRYKDAERRLLDVEARLKQRRVR